MYILFIYLVSNIQVNFHRAFNPSDIEFSVYTTGYPVLSTVMNYSNKIGSKFLYDNVELPNISTLKVYYLHHRYLVFTIYNKNNPIDIYCEEYISLHNLFSGPPNYHLIMNNKYDINEEVIVDMKILSDLSRTVNLFFKDIKTVNCPKGDDIYLEYIY